MHFLVVLIALVLPYGNAIINEESEVYPTHQASFADFPFMVSIGKKGTKLTALFTKRQGHFCGGALITRRHVLTAADCLQGERSKNLQVIVGMSDFHEADSTYDVAKWKTYNKWAKKLDSNSDHDIAIIKLAQCVSEKNVKTIEIYPRYLDTDRLILGTAGWGQTEKCKTASKLLKADLELVPLKSCEADLKLDTNRTYSIGMQHMCTRSDRQIRLGCGDSGGPLIIRLSGVPFLVGVNEAYCEQSSSFINTHARITYYKKFIDHAINSRYSCLFSDQHFREKPEPKFSKAQLERLRVWHETRKKNNQ